MPWYQLFGLIGLSFGAVCIVRGVSAANIIGYAFAFIGVVAFSVGLAALGTF